MQTKKVKQRQGMRVSINELMDKAFELWKEAKEDEFIKNPFETKFQINIINYDESSDGWIFE